MARGVRSSRLACVLTQRTPIDRLPLRVSRAVLHEALRCASRRLGGEPLAAAASTKPTLLRRRKCGDGPDWAWRGAMAAFCALRNKQQRRREQLLAGEGEGASRAPPAAAAPVAPVLCVAVSEYGTVRERGFNSANELAAAVVEELGEACVKGAAGAIARAVACPRGEVLLTTRLQIERQRALGCLMCADCGRFLRGERGLRMHRQVAHGVAYEVSASEARSACRALQVVAAPSEHLRRAWADEVAAREAAREALPPALLAARDGQVAELATLGAAAALEARDRFGTTALHFAAGYGALECVRWLVDEAGAHPDEAQVGKRGCGVGRTALHWAARNGHEHVARFLVAERGACPNVATSDGTTPLHLAVWRGNLELVRWMVCEAGADLHALNDHGCNAAQWAAQTGDTAMMGWLRDAGLDLKVLNTNAHSLVYKAASKGKARMCRWLLYEGGLCAPHVGADADGNTAAGSAAAESFSALAAWLAAVESLAAAAGGGELGGAELVRAADGDNSALWAAAAAAENT